MNHKDVINYKKYLVYYKHKITMMTLWQGTHMHRNKVYDHITLKQKIMSSLVEGWSVRNIRGWNVGCTGCVMENDPVLEIRDPSPVGLVIFPKAQIPLGLNYESISSTPPPQVWFN